jgi:hypothetical protein
MNEFIKNVIDETGLPEEKAEHVTNVIVQLLKKRLPDPSVIQIDHIVNGSPLEQFLDTTTENPKSLW